ncbi:prolyl oligopeptidase family serine peptidase [Streptomyces rectiverticillatus]|uniref:prolyl oligopeptidase family serine peptidase n=1 Tax=Streptomyces rectiverticillatus TaxID=173860 RepID=UPI003CCDAC7B
MEVPAQPADRRRDEHQVRPPGRKRQGRDRLSPDHGGAAHGSGGARDGDARAARALRALRPALERRPGVGPLRSLRADVVRTRRRHTGPRDAHPSGEARARPPPPGLHRPSVGRRPGLPRGAAGGRGSIRFTGRLRGPQSAPLLQRRGRLPRGRWLRRTSRPQGGPAARTIDDLCSAARALVDQGEADPGQLAGLAASNGGLVLAAAVLRAPRLFSAVACAAPLTDMARYTSGGGLGRLWHDEYGDPADPAALAALLAYSPYHHVRPGESYPATLLITGGNDVRVPPWHAWKLCAALQEATAGRRPVLLDHQPGTGHHGRTGTAATALSARVLALLATRTGLTAPTRPNPPSPTTDVNAPSALRALRQPTAPVPSSRSTA